jgi:serine/threonine protein kinase
MDALYGYPPVMNRQSEMDESNQYAAGGDAPSFCLGHPSHALQPGHIICRVCGALAANTEIGAYRVQKSLGMGRGGHAYLALHSTTRQPVCVKVTIPVQSNTQQWTQWEAARREVRSITALRHPAILPVFSCSLWQADTNKLEQISSGTDHSAQGRPSQTRASGNNFLLTLSQYVPGTLPYFVAHYQKRETQQQLYTRGIAPLKILLKLMMQIGSALQTAHSRGITHGAIVPGNILLANYERCWLADFGIAKLYAPPVPYLPPELYSASNASTMPNSFDAYWRAVTPLSDQYMFAMLCQQLLSQVLQPAEYGQILPVLQRATQSRPEQRYGSIDQLLQDLGNLSSSTTWSTSADNRQQILPSNRNTRSLQRGITMPESFAHPVTPVMALTSNYSRAMLPATPVATAETPADFAAYTPALVQSAGSGTPANAQGGPEGQALRLHSVDDWEKQGDRFFTQRLYDDALQAYHRAIEIVNNRATIWLALGDTYFALERYKEALMAYEQAMYLNPNDPQAWSSRGTVLDVIGRHKDAVDCYDRAEQLQLTS